MSPLQQKPILHGRDHACGGADPIPGICDLMGGATYEDAIRNADLTAWWQLGDTFAFSSSVADAIVDVADFDANSPRNLTYVEPSSSNRPTLQVAEAVDEGDPGAVELNNATSSGPRFHLPTGTSAIEDVTRFDTTGNKAQTVSAWLKVKAGMGAIYGPVLGRWGMDGSAADNVGWVIEVEQSTYVLRFRAKPTTGTTYLITGPTLTVDTWYHVAVTWDGATWTLYVNGGFYDDVAGASAPADPSDRAEFAIGFHKYDLGAGSQNQPFYGSVDSVAFWRRVLSAGEIADIAEGGGPGGVLTSAVESIAKSGDTALTGDVTLSEGSNVTLTQVGQDIEIAASGGSGIPDTLLDAKGDLIAASAADTAAKLTAGANNKVLTADSAQSTGLKWELTKVLEVKVIDDTTTLTTGDGKAIFCIPAALGGCDLTAAHAFVTTVSSSGLPTVQIRNVTQTADMLTTKITIDASEFTSYSAAAAAVIDTGNDDVATGDLIAVDVDVAGTGAKGLGVILTFTLP